MTTELVDKANQGRDFNQEDLRLLQTLIGMQGVEEPAQKSSPVPNQGQALAAPMVTTPASSAGYIYLRRASDGKLVLVSKNQLPERLRQRLPNGLPAWLPPQEPWTGRDRSPKLLCYLNQDHPNFLRMADLNLDPCMKRGKIANDAALRRHMVRKHKDSWDVIQREEQREKESLRDDRQYALLKTLSDSIQSNQPSQPTKAATVATVAKAVDANVKPVKSNFPLSISTHQGVFSVTCPTCDNGIEAASRVGVIAKYKAHAKKEHS